MNLYGQNPDTKLMAALELILEQAHISTIIETGTFAGESTKYFASLVKTVHTIEVRPDFIPLAENNIGQYKNVWRHLASSDEWLRENLEEIGKKWSILFFNDAHWQNHWPLENELKAINEDRARGRKHIVYIDDWLVPGKDNFAWCSGGGGTIGHEIYGPRTIEDRRPCAYETFADELDKFPFFILPNYDTPLMIGYCIASDFRLDLGSDFKVIR